MARKNATNNSEAGQESSGSTASKVKQLNILVYGLLILLFLGFATMFIAATSFIVDSFNNKQATYQQLEAQVQAQNTQIQVLTNQLRNDTITSKQ